MVASGTSLVPNRNGSGARFRRGRAGSRRRQRYPGIPCSTCAPHRTLSCRLFRFSAHSALNPPENFANEYRFRVRGHILVRRTAAATPGQQRQQRAASSRRGSLEDDQGNSG
ncbi:hypothetical protein A8E97_09625 [Burkholderia cenocepacia]|nr:hypothetical protein A8E88_05240 [Burkholderia cenocepacia]ONV79702.1 hypothetical protein A8E89_33300 [Burkholderia cenocepacia]ONW14447.1 hypothetical protein A8E94_13900 [Burkholderia cenocepacia]ONW23900.1 hypothetical protein A8E90_05315 [Burkholderia cenocepacia]ONW29459.1 hypothetical protein A8E99_37020 [Burkholderia cenocepacia]